MLEERVWLGGEAVLGVLTVGSGAWRGVRGCTGRWCGVGIVGGTGGQVVRVGVVVGVVSAGHFGMCCGACGVRCWE